MDENIKNFLNWQHWDLCKIVKKIPITKFVDPLGGTWDTVAPKASCGCEPESGENTFRFWLWCPKHVNDQGILVFAYKENRWFWVPNKVEVKK